MWYRCASVCHSVYEISHIIFTFLIKYFPFFVVNRQSFQYVNVLLGDNYGAPFHHSLTYMRPHLTEYKIHVYDRFCCWLY